MTPHNDQKQIMNCLGKIEAKLESLDKSQSRVTYALLGIIAAQIGVKILGTDPLLDVVTALALFGATLLFGCLIAGIRIVTNGKRPLTKTGLWFTIVVAFLVGTQMAVYFRDLGLLNLRIVYCLRIVQNLAIIMFGWHLLHSSRLFTKPPDSE